MIVYHYSASLKEGDRMIPGYQNNNDQPIWEYLSAEEAIAKKDITEMLKKQG